ncbi:MAG: DegT/DnrJ/EryC1/StrS family aminotransferase [Rhodothermales bacterium]
MKEADPAPEYLPYSRPYVTEDDIAAVAEVLRSPMISQGERLVAFEEAFAGVANARYATAFSSGTAALHGMAFAAGLGPGDEVILPPLTFAGTANAVLSTGATPVFADIDPVTFCLDPQAARRAVTPRTRAILTVDFAGRPSAYDDLAAVAADADALLLSDAAHAPGGRYRGRAIGSDLAAMTAFSFNPVKNLTAGEGGMVTTDDAAFRDRLVMLRAHGMTRDAAQLERTSPGGWYYEQQHLGFNYKLSELHAALGRSQLARLGVFNTHRRALACLYTHALADLPLDLPTAPEDGASTWHLYVVQVQPPYRRAALFAFLRERGFGVQVHYIPVPCHPYYQRLGYTMDACPYAARYYERALSLPLHPAMSGADARRVVTALQAFFKGGSR